MSPGTRGWPDGLRLRHELQPGDLGRLIALHGEVYWQLRGFGHEFEAFVARTVADYGLENDFNGRIWLLEHRHKERNELVGCCAIALRSAHLAQLRWVLLQDRFSGRGLGRRMVEIALDYCRESGVGQVFLETTDGLEASSNLYRKLGFRETSNEVVPLWREPRALIRMDLMLE